MRRGTGWEEVINDNLSLANPRSPTLSILKCFLCQSTSKLSFHYLKNIAFILEFLSKWAQCNVLDVAMGNNIFSFSERLKGEDNDLMRE